MISNTIRENTTGVCRLRSNRTTNATETLSCKDAFDPHFSIAKVDDYDQSEALRIAQNNIDVDVDAAAFELADIGMKNENWNIELSVTR